MWPKQGKGHVTLLNIIMDLKKCCNHPFLFESAEVRPRCPQLPESTHAFSREQSSSQRARRPRRMRTAP